MRCPLCGHDNTQIKGSRPRENNFWRGAGDFIRNGVLPAAPVHASPAVRSPLQHEHVAPAKPQGHISMRFDNAPPGTRISTRASGTAFKLDDGRGVKGDVGNALWGTNFSSHSAPNAASELFASAAGSSSGPSDAPAGLHFDKARKGWVDPQGNVYDWSDVRGWSDRRTGTETVFQTPKGTVVDPDGKLAVVSRAQPGAAVQAYAKTSSAGPQSLPGADLWGPVPAPGPNPGAPASGWYNPQIPKPKPDTFGADAMAKVHKLPDALKPPADPSPPAWYDWDAPDRKVPFGHELLDDPAAGIKRAAKSADDEIKATIVDVQNLYVSKLLLDQAAAGEDRNEKAHRENRPSGYDMTYNYGAYADNTIPLSQMTIGDVEAMQARMKANPKNKEKSTAVGRYQIMGYKLPELTQTLGYSQDTVFDQNVQDQMGLQLLKQRGLDDYLNRRITAADFQTNLSEEWASVEDPKKGRSHYDKGNTKNPQPVGTTTAQIQPIIRQFTRVPVPVDDLHLLDDTP